MRSYKHFCGLARALDVVGERWTLLVVRELLEGPRRYGELLEGLPGVATNLLAERLRSLEEAGVVVRDPEGCYALTPWGQGLHDVVYALGRWARPLMAKPAGDDEFRSNWFRHMVVARFDGVDKRRGELTIEIHTGDEPVTLVSAAGFVYLMRGRIEAPDLVLSGPPDSVSWLIAGQLDRARAKAQGVTIVGDVRKLRRLHPDSTGASQLKLRPGGGRAPARRPPAPVSNPR